MNSNFLDEYGWNEKVQQDFNEFSEYYGERLSQQYKPGRVLAVDRNGCLLATSDGIKRAVVSRMIEEGVGENLEAEKYQQIAPLRKPATGDWAAYLQKDEDCLIRAVLPRKSKFSRNAAGSEAVDEQVLTANIDYACIVTAMNRDMSVRRIERYLAAVYDSGCLPIIILNKADLCPDREPVIQAVTLSAIGVPVIVTSALSGEGVEELKDYLLPRKTYAFFGSSGVGKSSLLNRISENAHAEVREISEHSERGVHTTTRRQMYKLDNGSLIIDTPGLRAVQLWADSSTVDGLFEDVLAVTAQCRFSNCTHGTEPGCAVRKAVEEGTLSEKRLANYYKMVRELEYLRRKERIKRDRKAHKKFSRKRRKTIPDDDE